MNLAVRDADVAELMDDPACDLGQLRRTYAVFPVVNGLVAGTLIQAEWFSDSTTLTALEPGATGRFDWDGYGNFPFEVTEVEPTAVFGYRWSGIPAEELLSDDSTLVRFELADAADGTEITVIESGFEKLPGGTAYRRTRLEQNRDGWNIELDELAAALEG